MRGLSADGRRATGESNGPGGNVAFLWTQALGMVTLDSYLASNGVTVPAGWTLSQCTAVSAVGLTVAGLGVSPNSLAEGWVATIPGPQPLAFVGLMSLVALRRRDERRCNIGGWASSVISRGFFGARAWPGGA